MTWHTLCRCPFNYIFVLTFLLLFSLKISLKSVSNGLIQNKSTLVQVLVWCHYATSHYLTQCWIMMNGKYNAHTDALFEELEMLEVKDIFDVQCLKLCYKVINNKLPLVFKSMFTHNHKLYEMKTCMLYLHPSCTARCVLRHLIPVLLLKFPTYLVGKVCTHSIGTFVARVKSHVLSSYSYECTQMNCCTCQHKSK